MSAHEFRDDDDYLQWRNKHPHGFVSNIRRNHNPIDARLHDVSCGTLSAQIDRNVKLADQYVKVCGKTLEEMHSWAAQHVGGEILPCEICRGVGGPSTITLCPECHSYELLATGKCPSCDED